MAERQKRQYKRTFDNLEQFAKAMKKHYGENYADFIVEKMKGESTIAKVYHYYKTEMESLDNLIGFVYMAHCGGNTPLHIEATIYYGV